MDHQSMVTDEQLEMTEYGPDGRVVVGAPALPRFFFFTIFPFFLQLLAGGTR